MRKQSPLDRLEGINADWRAALDALPKTRQHGWTAAEDEAICRGYGVKGHKEFNAFMKKYFGRTAGAVNVRACRLRAAGMSVATYITREK